jgi:hypothetical protein
MTTVRAGRCATFPGPGTDDAAAVAVPIPRVAGPRLEVGFYDIKSAFCAYIRTLDKHAASAVAHLSGSRARWYLSSVLSLLQNPSTIEYELNMYYAVKYVAFASLKSGVQQSTCGEKQDAEALSDVEIAQIN